MRIQSPSAFSFFHGLAVGLQQRLNAGLQLQVAYNYSKSTDNGSGVTSSGENFAQGQRGVWYWDQSMKKGLSQFDQRQTLTTNFTWELPGQHMGGIAGAVIGGWQASGIITALDGHPLSLFNSTSQPPSAPGRSRARAPARSPPSTAGPARCSHPPSRACRPASTNAG